MAQILSFRRGRQSHWEEGSDQKQDGNSVKQILKAVLPWLTAVHMILRYGLRRLAAATPPFPEGAHRFLSSAGSTCCLQNSWVDSPGSRNFLGFSMQAQLWSRTPPTPRGSWETLILPRAAKAPRVSFKTSLETSVNPWLTHFASRRNQNQMGQCNFWGGFQQ